jgi:ribosomal protein S18 acetylase RimI-like enzyme
MIIKESKIRLKKLLGCWLSKIQDLRIYRKFVKPLRNGIVIGEAKIEEISKFSGRFSINQEVPISSGGSVTNFIAKRKRKIIAFVQLVKYPKDCEIWSGYWLFCLEVKFFYRRLGIGAELTKAVIEKAIRDKAVELSLLVFEDNYKAINLYKKFDFKKRIIPNLEELLENEKSIHGRRRVVLSKSLI